MDGSYTLVADSEMLIAVMIITTLVFTCFQFRRVMRQWRQAYYQLVEDVADEDAGLFAFFCAELQEASVMNGTWTLKAGGDTVRGNDLRLAVKKLRACKQVCRQVEATHGK